MSDAFEYTEVLPNEKLDLEAKSLIGFEARYHRIEKQLQLISDPMAIEAWAKKQYQDVPPIFKLVAQQYPLFLLEGDVGTGKTVFARCAANRITMSMRRDGHLYALSTRVRGSGKVGEASTRINQAFEHLGEQLGKSKLLFLLIDEADSLLTSRSEEHAHLEDKVAVNTIIQKVDHLRQHGGRFAVFLATNRVSTLDAAIRRRAAAIESFERPNDRERQELLAMDLAGLGLDATFVAKVASQTRAQNGSPGYTYSDFRTRFLPRIVANAYPDHKISENDVVEALAAVKPSPTVT